MLQSIKDKTRGWIAYVIVAVLVVPFASFGVYNYLTGGGDPTVAEVNGTDIKSSQLQNATQRQQRRLRQMLGDRYDPGAFDDSALERQALDQLITQRVLQDFATEHGLMATDAMVAATLRETPAFQRGGQFSPEQYRDVLRRSNMPVADYEHQIRRQQALGQLRDAVTSSALVTDAEMTRVASINYQSRDVAWLRVSTDSLKANIKVSDEDIESYYDAHQADFRRPRQVRLAYVTLSQDSIANGASISEDEVRARYDENKSQYQTPARRRVAHILIQVADEADAAAVSAAREKLVELRERIESGEITFAAAARDASEDPGSADEGGDLGMIRRGEMTEPFEQAAFDLDKGEISEPVRTDYGWHLIRVTEIDKATTQPFAEVRDEIRRDLAREAATTELFDQANRLSNLAYENRDSLQPAAEALGLTVQRTDWFSEQGADSGIAAEDKVVQAAFSPELIEEGRNSDVLVLDDDRRAVVRVDSSRPAKVLPLEQVRDRVVDELRGERARELAEEKQASLVTSIESGDASPESLAEAEAAVSFQRSGWIDRAMGGDTPPAVVRTAFRIPAPSGDGAMTARGTQLADGDYAAVVVSGVRDGKLEALSADTRGQLRQTLRQTDARSSEQDLIAELRAEADVSIYDQDLQ